MSAKGFRAELVGCLSQGADGNPSVVMVEAARLIGAVNCVLGRGDQLIGENTDGKGFLTSLRTEVDPKGWNVVLFGVGGAARAIAVELALAGAVRIEVVNRSPATGVALVALLGERTSVKGHYAPWKEGFEIPAGTDIVINATSVGLYDASARLPIVVDSLRPEMTVADMVFNPPETCLLREAKARGCATVDGLGMLVNQGVIGIKYWTGVDVGTTEIRRAIERALGLA
ncbi:MAG: shikimate dehydrogenase [Opitutus sp.]|nr:shikimate dehydrogenase [Opitutus sp.]